MKALLDMMLDGTSTVIPTYMAEIEQHRHELGVRDLKEFVYGMMVGSAMALGSTMFAAQPDGMPTAEDQAKMTKMIFDRMPEMREKVFG